MAAKLQCEICGGKLIGKPGGIFECENCGTEYSTEWAKAKIQEITGTVRVEGTVEVTGKVQVDGPVKVDSSANKEAMLQRGNLALEDGEWEKASELFDKVLSFDAHCAEAYLGLAMAEEKCRNRTAFCNAFITPDSSCQNNVHFSRAKQFANKELSPWLEYLMKEAQRRKLAKEQREQEVTKRARDDRERKVNELLKTRLDNSQTANVIAAGVATVGLRTDGTVVAKKYTGDFYCGQCMN